MDPKAGKVKLKMDVFIGKRKFFEKLLGKPGSGLASCVGDYIKSGEGPCLRFCCLSGQAFVVAVADIVVHDKGASLMNKNN